MDDFLLQLLAELEADESRKKIDSQIANELKGKVKHLQIQAEIDPQSLKNIILQIENAVGKTITIPDFVINQKQIDKTGNQAGQILGDAFQKSSKNSLKLDSVIDKQVSELMSKYDIVGKRGSKAFEEIRQAVIEYRKELNNVNNTKIDDDPFLSIDSFANKSNIDNVTSALTKHIKVADATKDVYSGLVEYIKRVNNSGTKIQLPDTVKQEYGDDFSSMRSTVGKAFTTGKGIDFESFVTELNNELGNVIDLSHGAESAFEDLVEKLRIGRGENFLSGNDLIDSGLLNLNEMEKDVTSAINLIENEEQKLAQASANATAEVVQNEEKKQEAIQETVKLYSELATFNKQFKENGITTVNNDGVVEMEKSLEKVRDIYSEFGKVTIKNEMTDLANGTEQFRVSIEQSNGELKRTESFLMKLSDDGKSFVFADDMIKSSESVVRHLNEQKEATDKVVLAQEKAERELQAQKDVFHKKNLTAIDYEIQKREEEARIFSAMLKAQMQEEQKLTNKVDKIQFSLDTDEYDSKVNNLISRTQQWTDENGNARISTINLEKSLDELQNAYEDLSKNNTVKNQQVLIEKEKEFEIQIKSVTSEVRTMNAEIAKSSAVNSLHNQVADFMSKNGKTVKRFGSELKDIYNKTAQGAKLNKTELAELKQKLADTIVEARKMGVLGKTGFQTLKEGISSFTSWLSASGMVMTVISKGKEGLSTVKELDTALVDLHKTADMTTQQMEDFYYSSNDVAKQMGVTTQEIIEQSAAWSRLGFSSAEAATKMAQLSSKFASISPGMSTDQAQSGMVSIIKAWGLDVDEVEREVMDNINTLGNNFAESNLDIIEGMQRSAAALAATGTSYQDAFALFTGAQEILQNAEVGGRALRSVTMRMHGYSENAEDGLMEVDEELKNITGELINLTKTAEHSQGVSMFKEGSNTEFKSLVEYFGEINDIWDEMSQKQQNDFLDKAFGKNQAQAGASIIQNYDSVTAAIEAMENAAGSSEREMSIIMDSVDYKLNKLKETGTGIAQNLFGREEMKSVIDALTKVGEAFDWLTDKIGLFGTLGAGAGIFAGFKNIGKFVRAYNFKSYNNCFKCFEYALHA